MALMGDTPVFLDSIYCGDDVQEAQGQALLVQEKLEVYGAMGTFIALATDSAAACTQMRRIVSAANPGLVSFNGQAHVANLLIGDLRRVPWMRQRIVSATTVSSYVGRHQRLQPAYTSSKNFLTGSRPTMQPPENKWRWGMGRPARRASSTTQRFVKRAHGIDRRRDICLKHRTVPSWGASSSPERIFPKRRNTISCWWPSRKGSTGSRILDPICSYLRLLEGTDGGLSFVLSATEQLERNMAAVEGALMAEGVMGTAGADVL